MEILGIGGLELVMIIAIMLVVAGPKRMIQWSYTAGRYLSQLRRMWGETAQMLQKEFDQAGIDVKVPEKMPTRASIRGDINRALSPVTKPIQDQMDAVKNEVDIVKDAATIPGLTKVGGSKLSPNKPFVGKTGNPATKPVTAATVSADSAPEPQPEPSFGSWSGGTSNGAAATPPEQNGSFGSWSAGGKE